MRAFTRFFFNILGVFYKWIVLERTGHDLKEMVQYFSIKLKSYLMVYDFWVKGKAQMQSATVDLSVLSIYYILWIPVIPRDSD